MALERKDLRAILEDETADVSGKMKKILDMLHVETDNLQNQLDAANAATAAAEKERDDANTGKQAAEQALNDYKAEQERKASRAAKVTAFKALLKEAGVYEKRIDSIAEDSKKADAFIDALDLDEEGKVKDHDAQLEKAKTDFKASIAKTTTTGAPVDTPPQTYTGTTREQYQKMSLDDRIKLKSSDPELYRQLRGGK